MTVGKHPRRRYLIEGARRLMDDFRVQVSRPDAVPQLALLGIVSGVLAGVTVVAFRLLVEWAQSDWLPQVPPERYGALDPLGRIVLATGGGLLIGLIFQLLPTTARRVGVLHVMERLAYHQGHLPWRNALAQFVGGVLALAAGHSVGREGPSAHLGAASGNLPAQWAGLPNNSLRVLAACGAAAGIAASFNTPLAGVAFSMEVLMLEYTVAGFTPVILATVSATMLTRAVFGHDLAFSVPPLSIGSLSQLPYILVCGLAIGVLAAAFIHLLRFVSSRGKAIPVWLRLTLAGLVVGVCGAAVPEAMGLGHDTVNQALLAELGLGLMLLLLLAKMVATCVGIGLGIPGGVIGPSLVLGAAAGGVLGIIGQWLGAVAGSGPGLYAMVGMGAMMAGILQAPLAGLIAILELTGNPNIILPGMLAVIGATIVSGRLSPHENVFQTLMHSLGLNYHDDPVTQSLRRMGVAGVMERAVGTMPQVAERERIERELEGGIRWIVVRREPEQPPLLLAAVDLARAVREQPAQQQFDLLEIPGTRLQIAEIDMQSNLQQALERIESTGAEALYVTRHTVPGLERIYGVLTRQDIEGAYRL